MLRSRHVDKSFQTDLHSYKAESLLAHGGMGSIYLGRRTKVGADGEHDEVVIKQLPPEHAQDPKLIELFVREAALVASLSHKNIVRVFDLVKTMQGSVDEYYIVMEYVRGGDLRTLLRRARRRQGRLSLDSILFIACEVLSALSCAHEKRNRKGAPLGLVHRDVSPSNILLGASGVVKLTDFGIAKSPTLGSVVFKVKGKLGYMAPEQARGEPVDRRADLFAVGVMLYELLVGERLFVGSTLQSPAMIFAQPVLAPSRSRTDVTPDLDAVVLRALALDRDARWATADEMRAALLHVAQRTTRALDERTLAADLLRACGNDPTAWLGPDAPMGATLEGAPSGDGTNVIITADEDLDDRPSGTRPNSLPERELTSIVQLVGGADFEPPPTLVQQGPGPAYEPGPGPDSDGDSFDADSEVRTRVQPAKYVASHPPRAAALSARVARAAFEAPVPRQSPPLPSEHSLQIPVPPVAQPASRDLPTRLTSSGPLKIVEATAERVRDAAPRAAVGGQRLPSRAELATSSIPVAAASYGPASLAALERTLSGRTPARLVVTVLTISLLIALGVGLGVLLSGEPMPATPAGPTPQAAPPAQPAPTSAVP